MNKREIAEIKKALKPDSCCLTDIAICYVSLENGPRILEKKNFLSLEEETLFKFLELSKKSLSGKLGKNQVELEAANPNEAAVASGVFKKVYESRTDEGLEAVCEVIQENFVSETDYCVLFLFGTYDVPCSNKAGDEFLGSDDVYSFMQCIIVPVKLSKPGLAVNLSEGQVAPKELFHELEAPYYAFLYPAFTDRATDVDHVMFYTKSAKNYPEELLDKLLHAKVPSCPDTQQQVFCRIMEAGFGGKVPFDATRGVYETLAEKAAENNDVANVLFLSQEELVSLVKKEAELNGLVFDEEAAAEEAESGGVQSFIIDNIVPEKLTLEADDMAVKVPKESMYRLERRLIDGVDYYLIPAAGSLLENMETANKNEIRKN